MPQISRQVLATLVNWSSGTILGSAKFQARSELRPEFITWLVPINAAAGSLQAAQLSRVARGGSLPLVRPVRTDRILLFRGAVCMD